MARLTKVARPVIGVVAPMTQQTVSALQGYDIVEFGIDDLSVARLTAQKKIALLIVGGNCQPLKTVLPVLRASMPYLPIIALADTSLDRASLNFYRNHVDGLYELSTDIDKLAQAVSSDESSRSSNWKLSVWKKLGNGLLTTIVLLGLWWLAVLLFQPAPYLLPSPVSVIGAFYSQAGKFLFHLGVTAYEAILGFMIGNAIGIFIAVSLHRYVGLKKFTLPVLISFQAIPIVAIAPLLVVWFGTGMGSKIIMAAILCFFPMVINALQAFSDVDRDYVELFEFYQASFMVKLKMLLMPASFHGIVSALKISAGLSVVGAIVAELTGASRGLGYILLNASYRLETEIMFVAMLLSAVLGMVFFQMPSLLRFIVPKSWSMTIR